MSEFLCKFRNVTCESKRYAKILMVFSILYIRKWTTPLHTSSFYCEDSYVIRTWFVDASVTISNLHN